MAELYRFSQVTDDQRLRAKVFGIGSAGCGMIDGLELSTIAFSTSPADLAKSHAERKFLVGSDRLTGISATESDVLKKLPDIVGHELLDLFNNTDVAFLMCGLGGLTGSLGSRMISSIARVKGTMGIVLATTPFSAESFRRRELVNKIMNDLVASNTLVVEFDNDKLSSLGPNMPLSRAFSVLNGIMLRPVEDICSAMSRADIPSFRHLIGDSTLARFGLGLGRGDERVERAVSEALSSPWFDFETGAAPAAIAIYSASDPWDKEAERICHLLQERLASASLIVGSYPDPSLGDRIRLSLLVCRSRAPS